MSLQPYDAYIPPQDTAGTPKPAVQGKGDLDTPPQAPTLDEMREELNTWFTEMGSEVRFLTADQKAEEALHHFAEEIKAGRATLESMDRCFSALIDAPNRKEPMAEFRKLCEEAGLTKKMATVGQDPERALAKLEERVKKGDVGIDENEFIHCELVIDVLSKPDIKERLFSKLDELADIREGSPPIAKNPVEVLKSTSRSRPGSLSTVKKRLSALVNHAKRSLSALVENSK